MLRCDLPEGSWSLESYQADGTRFKNAQDARNLVLSYSLDSTRRLFQTELIDGANSNSHHRVSISLKK